MLKSNPNQVSNNQHRRVMLLKYKAKCDAVKRKVTHFMMLNAALSDEIAIMQEELIQARKDRRYLLQRLLRYEPPETPEKNDQKPKHHKQQKKLHKSQQLTQPNITSPAASTSAEKTITTPQPATPGSKKRGPKKRIPSDRAQFSMQTKNKKTQDKIVLDSEGKPLFPINLCTILIHSLGEIAPYNSSFQSMHWIYPVGYVTTRVYAHPKFPLRKCVYTCKILNNGGKPQFQIIPDNDLENVFFGDSAYDCHRLLLEMLQRRLADVIKIPMLIQGEKFFGLSNPDIKSLLQMDPGFKLCIDFKGFIEKDPSGDIPEENDPTLSYEALQSLLNISAYHTIPEPRDQPPDELLNFK